MCNFISVLFYIMWKGIIKLSVYLEGFHQYLRLFVSIPEYINTYFESLQTCIWQCDNRRLFWPVKVWLTNTKWTETHYNLLIYLYVPLAIFSATFSPWTQLSKLRRKISLNCKTRISPKNMKAESDFLKHSSSWKKKSFCLPSRGMDNCSVPQSQI